MRTRRLRKHPLTIGEILAWARAHREAAGKWPTPSSGTIVGAKFEKWVNVNQALRMGTRGLPGGSSLFQLLAEKHGVRIRRNSIPLSVEQILRWADEHHDRTGAWPTSKPGAIPGAPRESWQAINAALIKGSRELPGGSSLAKLLAEHRGVRHRKQPPPFSEEQILQWIDAFHERMGAWPIRTSGPIAEAPGETWEAVHMALRFGFRGMAGGSTLARLLAEKRGARNIWSLPTLSLEQILTWADAFHERTGSWPRQESGPIPEAPGETWTAVDQALRRGSRGLPRAGSLSELLARKRGVRRHTRYLTVNPEQILAWADAHQRRTGKWPTPRSGPVLESPGVTWKGIDRALREGLRGLRPGSSLPRLLATCREQRNRGRLPPMTKQKTLS